MGIQSSVATLSWSVLILLVVQCMFGMIMSQIVLDFIMHDSHDIESRKKVFSYYGTFTRSLITMFEIHLANFAPACRVIVENVGELYGYIFLTYRCVVGFAILNVINAVFIQQTVAVAQQDHDLMIDQKDRAAEKFKKQLAQMFLKLDDTGDGNVTIDELRTA